MYRGSRADKAMATAQEVKCVQTYSELSQKQRVVFPLRSGSKIANGFQCKDRSRTDQCHGSRHPQVCSRLCIVLLCCLPAALFGQATLTSPVPGSTLAGPSVTFTWTAGTGTTSYDLWLGLSGPGSSSLYATGWLTTTSTTVPSLPTKGATVYARLYSLGSGGEKYNDYIFTESMGMPAALISPTAGSGLGASNQIFTWTAGTAGTEYDLWLGLSPGSYNLYATGWLTTTSTTVPSLPAKGATVYARLYSLGSGGEQYSDYIFTEPTSMPAAMVSPTAGSLLGSANQTFTWTAGTAVTEYDLWLGLNGPGSSSLYTTGWLTTTSTTVPRLPANGATVYARLYSNGSGGEQYSDYTFREAGGALLSGFSCTSTSMTGSGTDACTVTLNAAAPSGGLAVSLSSSNLAATVPANVMIPASAISVGFITTVSSVGTAQPVTLTAVGGGVSETVFLQLNADLPTLSVATSASPSTYGGALTFTATLSTDPAGSVTFDSGGVSIGTGTINGTTATLTSSSLTAGSHTITAIWAGNSNYGAATSGALTQVVNKATPAITWAAPVAITSGTALGSTQLDATASVPGSFAYSPAVGTVLAAGAQTLTVIFTPTDTVDYNNASVSVTLTVNQGTSTLSINATSIGFGNVALNQPATQTLTLSSTGTSSVTVNSAVLVGAGFTLSGTAFPTTLAPGQTATAGVQFDPTAVGAASGTLTISSTSSSNGTATIALTGTGTAASYAVDLSWDAPVDSTDPVAGYNIYRSPVGSSTYQLLNSSVEALTAYVDSTVQAGSSYDYIVESVDASGVESVPTSPVALTIP
jgi:hypothetical protein